MSGLRFQGAMVVLVRELAGAAIAEPGREALDMIAHATGIPKATLYRDDPPIGPGVWERIAGMVRRRLAREPLEYITGLAGFMGRDFRVGPGVLVPRPETELLVEEALTLLEGRLKDRANDRVGVRVLDLCTGSGCIAISLALAHPGLCVTAVDISHEALAYAHENAIRLGATGVTLRRGDLYAPVRGERFDLIVSNPPYIPALEIPTLAPEVSSWEPALALDGGPSGLGLYERILAGAPEALCPGAIGIILELGLGQAGDVPAIVMHNLPQATVRIVPDLAGIDRILLATL